MIATLMLTLTALPQQATTQAWEHVLVRHESFEDFYADGLSSAHRAQIDALAPVVLQAGVDSTSSDPNEAGYAQAPEWANGFFESAELVVPGGFSEVLVSWNAVVPAQAGMCMELRVRGEAGEWSPWMWLGDWGQVLPPPLYLRRADPGGPRVDAQAPRVTSFDGGKIDVDFFRSDQRFARAQYRVRTEHERGIGDQRIVLRRVSLCFSRKVDAAADAHVPAACALDVPFRSQKVEDPALAGRICSPTSVAMVLAYRGVQSPTGEVARVLYDARNDIYGNWTRAIQGAYQWGVPGYLTRLSNWKDVEALVSKGQPLVISIAAQAGQLTGAPYPSTDGHLLVVTGFDPQGNVRVNDPAASDEASGKRVYARSELENVWLRRGGTTYVLLAREKAAR